MGKMLEAKGLSGDGNRVIGEMRGRNQLSIYEKAL